MFPVYLITCHHPSYGRYIMPYVGVVLKEGKTIEQRFKEHCQKDGGAKYLSRAIEKYGREHFRVEQIDAGNTPEQALELEKWWIARLKTRAPEGGYNLTDGGEGVVNPPAHVIEIRRKNGRKMGLIYGPIYGPLNVGQLASVSAKGGRIQGRLTGRIYGPINGRKSVESGHMAKMRTPENCAKGGRIAGRIAGRKNVLSGHWAAINHQRWHAKRNLINPVCPFCQKPTIKPIKQT